jgi:hypothetical protein
MRNSCDVGSVSELRNLSKTDRSTAMISWPLAQCMPLISNTRTYCVTFYQRSAELAG